MPSHKNKFSKKTTNDKVTTDEIAKEKKKADELRQEKAEERMKEKERKLQEEKKRLEIEREKADIKNQENLLKEREELEKKRKKIEEKEKIENEKIQKEKEKQEEIEKLRSEEEIKKTNEREKNSKSKKILDERSEIQFIRLPIGISIENSSLIIGHGQDNVLHKIKEIYNHADYLQINTENSYLIFATTQRVINIV